jgi:hypothetical protein
MNLNKFKLENEGGSESRQNEQVARSEAECQSHEYKHDSCLSTLKIGIGGGEVPSPPYVLVYNTNNTSQRCFERNELLTIDDEIACETENFLEYLDLLEEKAVLMRSRLNFDKGIIIKPCESSRYFEGGRKKTKRNLKKRFGKNFAAPGVFLTLTYDHEKYSRWEA